MLKTGEMLNMLNVLNVWGKIRAKKRDFGDPTFNIFNISLVLSIFRKKYLTFPRFREPKVTNWGNVKYFLRKMLKTGEMLNMLNVFKGLF